MARSVRHLTETAALLTDRGIDLVVLKQGIDTTTPAGRFTFHVLAAMDEMLADLISEGTREGLESARARGRAGGRKPKLTTRQAEVARGIYDETGADGRRKYTVAEIAETFGVSRKTVCRHLEPSAGRRQPGKSARPAAPAGPLATLPDPATTAPASQPPDRGPTPLPGWPTWGADQVSPKGAVGLGRGPGRFLRVSLIERAADACCRNASNSANRDTITSKLRSIVPEHAVTIPRTRPTM